MTLEPTVTPTAADTASPGVVDAVRLLEVVAHAAPVVIWAMDADGMCTLSIGRGLAAFGVVDGELVGRSVIELFPDPQSQAMVRRALGGETFQAQSQLMGRDFLTWYEPVLAADGSPRGCYAITVDVSGEELRHAVELERVRDQATVLHYLLANDETDRRAVARDLHDDVIQVVTGLGLRVDLLRRIARDGGPGAVAELDEELAALDDAVTAMTERLRAVIGTLEPLDVDGGDLGDAIRGLVEHAMGPLGVDRAVTVEAAVEPPDLVARVLYRVVQEALTNVARHARASRVEVVVRLRSDQDTWVLEVRDDGIGTAVGYGERTGHRGLRGMRERVELAGGSFTVGPGPAGGTLVHVELPGRLPEPGPPEAAASGPTLARVLSTVSDALAVVDHSWRLVYTNDRCRQLLGLTDATDPAPQLWSVVGWAERGLGRGMLERAMEEKRETTFEAGFAGRWLRVRAVPSREGLLVLARDLTAQRDMQRRLLDMAAPGPWPAPPHPDGVASVVSALVSSGRFVRAQVVADDLGVVASASQQAPSSAEVGEPVFLELSGGRLEVTPTRELTPEDEAVLDLAVRTLFGLRAATANAAAPPPQGAV